MHIIIVSNDMQESNPFSVSSWFHVCTYMCVCMYVCVCACLCRHIGDEWLVTEEYTEAYIPDVTEVSAHVPHVWMRGGCVPTCVCVDMHRCVHPHVHVWAYVQLYIHMHVHVWACAAVQPHVHVCGHVQLCIHMCVCGHAGVHPHVHVWAWACAGVSMHGHTHPLVHVYVCNSCNNFIAIMSCCIRWFPGGCACCEPHCCEAAPVLCRDGPHGHGWEEPTGRQGTEGGAKDLLSAAW